FRSHFHGFGLAHRAGKTLGATDTRADAEVDFRLTELGLASCDDKIAHHRNLTAPTECVAIDRRNNRCAHSHELLPISEPVSFVHINTRQRRHLLDVSAGSKGFLRTGENNRANVFVLIESTRGLDNLRLHLLIKSIECLRSVEGNQTNLVASFYGDAVVFHNFSPCLAICTPG